MDPYHLRNYPYSSYPPSIMGNAYIGNSNIMPLQPNPYQSPMPPYQPLNESSLIPPSLYQQTPIHPHIPGPMYPQYLMYEEPTCCSSLAETLCCCFGFGKPQDPFEERVMMEMNMRRRAIKEHKKEQMQRQMQNYKNQQEKQQLAQQQQLQKQKQATQASEQINT